MTGCTASVADQPGSNSPLSSRPVYSLVMKTATPSLSLLAVTVASLAGWPSAAPIDERSNVHYAGEDCLECHADYRVGGTVYTDSTGMFPLPDVPLAFITPEGEMVGSDISDTNGNIWSYTLPDGFYLIQLGAISSRTWHAIPWQSSCNSCHSPRCDEPPAGSIRLPEQHTRLGVGNECRPCHGPAGTRSPDRVSPARVLNGTREPLPVPATTVTILDRSFTAEPSRHRPGTVRPDVFTRGFFSLFDVILDEAERNGIAITYEYDAAARTHWITSIDGVAGEYWYRWSFGAPRSAAGSADDPDRDHACTDRWDENLWRPGVKIRVVADNRVSELRRAYREEIRREEESGHTVEILTITARTPEAGSVPASAEQTPVDRRYTEVAVTPHDLRAPDHPSPYSKPFQPGVVTALDALLSLRDQGELDQVETVFVDRLAGNWVYGYFVPTIGIPGDGMVQAPGLPGFISRTHPGPIAEITDTPPFNPIGSLAIPPDLQVIHAPVLSRWQMAVPPDPPPAPQRW